MEVDSPPVVRVAPEVKSVDAPDLCALASRFEWPDALESEVAALAAEAPLCAAAAAPLVEAGALVIDDLLDLDLSNLEAAARTTRDDAACPRDGETRLVRGAVLAAASLLRDPNVAESQRRAACSSPSALAWLLDLPVPTRCALGAYLDGEDGAEREERRRSRRKAGAASLIDLLRVPLCLLARARTAEDVAGIVRWFPRLHDPAGTVVARWAAAAGDAAPVRAVLAIPPAKLVGQVDMWALLEEHCPEHVPAPRDGPSGALELPASWAPARRRAVPGSPAAPSSVAAQGIGGMHIGGSGGASPRGPGRRRTNAGRGLKAAIEATRSGGMPPRGAPTSTSVATASMPASPLRHPAPAAAAKDSLCRHSMSSMPSPGKRHATDGGKDLPRRSVSRMDPGGLLALLEAAEIAEPGEAASAEGEAGHGTRSRARAEAGAAEGGQRRRRRGRGDLSGPCCHCGCPSSPQWRKGPPCKPALCNACGTRYLRSRHLAHRAAIAAGASAGPICETCMCVGCPSLSKGAGAKGEAKPAPQTVSPATAAAALLSCASTRPPSGTVSHSPSCGPATSHSGQEDGSGPESHAPALFGAAPSMWVKAESSEQAPQPPPASLLASSPPLFLAAPPPQPPLSSPFELSFSSIALPPGPFTGSQMAAYHEQIARSQQLFQSLACIALERELHA